MKWTNDYAPQYHVTNLEVTPSGGGKPTIWATMKKDAELEQLVLAKQAEGYKVRVSFWDNCYGEPVWLETLPDGKTVLLSV